MVDALNSAKGWFSEVNDQWPGQCMSLQIEKVLHDAKSQYQHVIVFKSRTWGNVLILDGVIQLTEKDECAYQEMITHLPMFSHPNPQSVLIVGGGDGGVIREVLKHQSVTSVTICEIDQMVVDVSKKYFPTMSHVWSDPRLKVICNDAAVYMESKEAQGKYDVIVCDSSDPVGPAQVLFESKFYKAMEGALKPGGRIATQAESIWNNQELIANLFRRTLSTFAAVEYASTQVPTYPCGQIGFLCCSKSDGKTPNTMAKPIRAVPSDMKLHYYHGDLHAASFVLPNFMRQLIERVRAEHAASPASGAAGTAGAAAAPAAAAAADNKKQDDAKKGADNKKSEAAAPKKN
jgi:spermidine synthase